MDNKSITVKKNTANHIFLKSEETFFLFVSF